VVWGLPHWARGKTVYVLEEATRCEDDLLFGSSRCVETITSSGRIDAECSYGQRDAGTGTGDSSVPDAAAASLSGVRALSARGERTCALVTDGTVHCWGTVGRRNGVTVKSRTPIQVPGIAQAVSINGDCALLQDGRALCWGDDVSEDSTSPIFTAPVLVASNATAVVAGGCAILTDQTVTCWSNARSESAAGTPAVSEVRPELAGARSLLIVEPELEHAPVAGLMADGSVRVTSLGPPLPLGAASLSSGTERPCIVKADGTAHCADGWYRALEPVPGLSGVKAVVTNGSYETRACALLADETVKCWGWGPLGNGSTESSDKPVEVIGANGATAVAVTPAGGCVALNGMVKCWGQGSPDLRDPFVPTE
jgi:hypothetical protein